MRKVNKEEFEALYQLRKKAESCPNLTDKEKEKIKANYFALLEGIIFLYNDDKLVEDEKEENKEKEKILEKYKTKFPSITLQGIAKKITEYAKNNDISGLSVYVDITNDGRIKITERLENGQEGDTLREYDDENDYFINIDEDLKVKFDRKKMFADVMKLRQYKEK